MNQLLMFKEKEEFDPELYLEERPEIYSLFKHFAEQKIEAGFRKYSARTIIHRIRWETDIAPGNDGFKINNDISPFLARKLAEDDPRFENFFEFRRVR